MKKSEAYESKDNYKMNNITDVLNKEEDKDKKID